MDHLAIMKRSWGLTQKILSGEKTIETRWYRNKSKPWDMIKTGETLYLKDSGCPVTVKAEIVTVEQFEDLDDAKIEKLLKNYNPKNLGTLGLEKEIKSYISGKKYAILIHLKDPQSIKPFEIEKRGFGAMSAWICVKDINEIKK